MTGAPTPDLPPSLRGVVAAIGEEKTLELISRLGGIAVYVPSDPKPGAMLVDTIGVAAARKLAVEYGGEHLKLPLASKAVTFWLHALGKSNNEIAIIQRCSAYTVHRRLTGKSNPPGSQMDLFAAE